MDDAFKGSCGGYHGDETCPICRGDVSGEFVSIIEQAAAQPGRVMTAEEFIAWLDSL